MVLFEFASEHGELWQIACLLGMGFYLMSIHPRRNFFVLRLLFSVTVCLTAAYFSGYLTEPESPGIIFLIYLVFFTVCMLVWWFCFDLPFRDIFGLGIVAYSICHLVYILSWICFVSFGERLYQKIGVGALWIITIIMTVFYGLGFLVARLFRIQGEEEETLHFLDAISVRALLGLNMVLAVLMNLYTLGSASTVPEYEYIMLILNACMCISSLFGAYFQMILIQKSVDSERITFIREKERQVYLAEKQSADLINVKCHDLRKQIRLLSKYNVIPEEEIERLTGAIRVYDTRMKTGSDALDLVLREKMLTCGGRGIVLSCIADGNALSFLNEYEIYNLFGNILDNAIEAVSRVPEAKRQITLKVNRTAGGVLVYESNPTNDAVEFGKDGLPLTNKSNKQQHGFGSKSIQMTVNEHQGILTYSNQDGFSVKILFPYQEADVPTK